MGGRSQIPAGKKKTALDSEPPAEHLHKESLIAMLACAAGIVLPIYSTRYECPSPVPTFTAWLLPRTIWLFPPLRLSVPSFYRRFLFPLPVGSPTLPLLVEVFFCGCSPMARYCHNSRAFSCTRRTMCRCVMRLWELVRRNAGTCVTK